MTLPVHLFVENNKPSKTCSKCQEKHNNRYARKHAANATNNTMQQIAIEDLMTTLESFKGKDISDSRYTIDINELIAHVDKEQMAIKDIPAYLAEGIFTATGFKFK